MMRTDEPAVLVTKDELISSLTRWRLNEIDRISADILFEEQLRQVAFAIAEPEETPVMRLPSPVAWLLQALFYVGISGVVYAVFR